MLVGVVLNGVSLSSLVPMLDIIISGKQIMLPSNLPVVVSSRLEPFICFLNSLPPVVLLKYLIVFIVTTIFLKGLFLYMNNYCFHFLATGY